MAKFIDVGVRVKARQQAFRDQGLCACGDRRRGGISPRTKRLYLTCQRCFDRAAAYNSGERKNKAEAEPIDDGVPFPITTTDLCYQVLRSGKVGVVVPSHLAQILSSWSSETGSEMLFHLRELELCDLSVSRSENSNYKKNKDGNMGRPKGVEADNDQPRCSRCTVSSNVNLFLSSGQWSRRRWASIVPVSLIAASL